MFMRSAKLTWPQVRLEAVKFLPTLQQPAWMPLVEEMRGVADGAGLDFEDILTLNVRTEIAYGMFSDGCTAFSWKVGEKSFLAQNWDVSFINTWHSETSSIGLKVHSGRTSNPQT
jgi:isopenicillin-N N-acyltransferase like protein